LTLNKVQSTAGQLVDSLAFVYNAGHSS